MAKQQDYKELVAILLKNKWASGDPEVKSNKQFIFIPE